VRAWLSIKEELIQRGYVVSFVARMLRQFKTCMGAV